MGKAPVSAATSSRWPLPETPATPTISPGITFSVRPSTAERPSTPATLRLPMASRGVPEATAAGVAGLACTQHLGQGRGTAGRRRAHRRGGGRRAGGRHLVGVDAHHPAGEFVARGLRRARGAGAPAAAQHGDLVAEAEDLAELVGDDQHRQLLAPGTAPSSGPAPRRLPAASAPRSARPAPGSGGARTAPSGSRASAFRRPPARPRARPASAGRARWP